MNIYIYIICVYIYIYILLVYIYIYKLSFIIIIIIIIYIYILCFFLYLSQNSRFSNGVPHCSCVCFMTVDQREQRYQVPHVTVADRFWSVPIRLWFPMTAMIWFGNGMVMTEGWCKWHGFSHMKNMTLVSRGTIVIIVILSIYGDLESGLYHLLIMMSTTHVKEHWENRKGMLVRGSHPREWPNNSDC